MWRIFGFVHADATLIIDGSRSDLPETTELKTTVLVLKKKNWVLVASVFIGTRWWFLT